MSDSDQTQQAIRQVIAGNRDAFRVLVREYRLMVRSYLGSQLHRGDEMDDLSQEVFMTAFRNLNQFDDRGDFGAWLRGIARNQLLMHFRSLGRRKAKEAKFREQVTQLIEHDLERTFDEQTEFAIESLLRCTSRLPERMRQVVRRGLEGTKAAAMADELAMLGQLKAVQSSEPRWLKLEDALAATLDRQATNECFEARVMDGLAESAHSQPTVSDTKVRTCVGFR